MTNASDLLGNLTAAIEDVFGIAVEGRGDDLSPDMLEALLPAISEGLDRAHRIVLDALARP